MFSLVLASAPAPSSSVAADLSADGSRLDARLDAMAVAGSSSVGGDGSAAMYGGTLICPEACASNADTCSGSTAARSECAFGD